MKKLLLYLLLLTAFKPVVFCQNVVYTPKGSTVSFYQNSNEMSDEWRHHWDSTYSANYPNATLIQTYGGYSSTLKFNCHGYAWHVSEGGQYIWIGSGPYNKDEAVYWTDPHHSYIQVGSPYYPGGKVSYGYFGNHDHSAVVADPSSYGSGRVVSKWGDKVLMRHAYDDCPYSYDSVKYFKLDPTMNGSINILCNNVQRAFNTDITHMDNANLSWSSGSYLEIVSGAGTPQYTVRGTGNGSTYVGFQITTYSGFTWSSTKNFWAGTFENTWVTGQTAICPNTTYTYTAQVYGGHSSSYTYYWTYPSNWTNQIQYQNNIQLHTPSSPNYGTVRVAINNTCGTSGYSGITVYPKSSCGKYFSIFPNPVSTNEITISLQDSFLTLSDTTDVSQESIFEVDDPNSIYSIKIYNSKSMLISTFTRSGMLFTIPLINFSNGIYVVEITDGRSLFRQQLIVNHD